jgi:hypothetical protein
VSRAAGLYVSSLLAKAVAGYAALVRIASRREL